jgi:hypothetical protein
MTRSNRKILFVCGSLHQTSQMHQIARELPEYEHVFTPYYGNRDFDFARSVGALETTIGGHKLTRRCLDYLRDHRLPCEPGGALGDFDLAFHCSDLVWPKNLDGKPVVLVQEGMTDPPTKLLPLVRHVSALPRWLAGTSALGLSHRYARFCVASEGYAAHFAENGCDPDRLVVTGIPNFDQCARYAVNDFPLRGYVLACTSDTRETFGREDRAAFLRHATALARERYKQLVVKLHPNEDVARATAEVRLFAPDALVYSTGSAEEMVANCATLVVTYSSLAYVGLALGKEVHSSFDVRTLSRLLPLQNGRAAKNIANVARELLAPKPNGASAAKPARAPSSSREVLS